MSSFVNVFASIWVCSYFCVCIHTSRSLYLLLKQLLSRCYCCCCWTRAIVLFHFAILSLLCNKFSLSVLCMIYFLVYRPKTVEFAAATLEQVDFHFTWSLHILQLFAIRLSRQRKIHKWIFSRSFASGNDYSITIARTALKSYTHKKREEKEIGTTFIYITYFCLCCVDLWLVWTVGYCATASIHSINIQIV